MALFDDDEQSADDTESESDSWGVDDASDAPTDEPADSADQSEPTPLSDLDTASLSRGDPNGTLKRAIDREAGVVIYAYKNGRAGGVSTVPLSETDLVTEDG